MEQPKTTLEDWRTEITEGTATLKIKDGDVAEVTFTNEGVKKVSIDYGSSIAFGVILNKMTCADNSEVIIDSDPKTFYVKSNNYDLLSQIKVLGKLTGTKARISRIGSTKSNTRYKIVTVR